MNPPTKLMSPRVIAICVTLAALTASDGALVCALTDLSNRLVRYDGDSLAPIGPGAGNNAYAHHDLAFDQSGRLFGVGSAGGGEALFEYDPLTGAVLHSQPVMGTMFGLAARDGVIYSLTTLNNTLMRFSADTLTSLGPAPIGTNGYTTYDLAFDPSGRLFGLGSVGGGEALLELDPRTGEVLHSQLVMGTVYGIAARNGVIYALTNLDNTLVRFGMDTLTALGPAMVGNNAFMHYDLAFEPSGRLFGLGFVGGGEALLEFDPVTGTVIDSRSVMGTVYGIAAVPEPSIMPLLLPGAMVLAARRRTTLPKALPSKHSASTKVCGARR